MLFQIFNVFNARSDDRSKWLIGMDAVQVERAHHRAA
jgi:hypothetical protein